MSVITNTTVLSNFASIDQLDLLHRLYGTLYMSTEVYEEIQTGLEEGYQFYGGIDTLVFPLAEDGWIQLTSMADAHELRLFGTLPARLHRGEASCLAIAHQRGWLLLTDDRDARDAARQMGIRVSGSVGSLVLAIERSLCTLQQANTWLQAMIQQGYYSPVTDLAALLQSPGERSPGR